jgi:hypothetical protein
LAGEAMGRQLPIQEELRVQACEQVAAYRC